MIFHNFHSWISPGLFCLQWTSARVGASCGWWAFTLSVCISARLRKGGNMNPWFCITLDQQVSEQKWWHLSCNWNNNNTKKFPLIWWSVSLLCQVNHGEILAGWPVQGFRADLVCRLPTQLLIIEVNSQQRCWIARDGKWRDSWDDSFPFPTKKLTQVGMSAKPKASPFLFGKRLFFKKTILAPVICGDTENQTQLSELQEKIIKSSISFVKKHMQKLPNLLRFLPRNPPRALGLLPPASCCFGVGR